MTLGYSSFRAVQPQSGIKAYEWEELSGWDLPEKRKKLEIAEVLWPTSAKGHDLLRRARIAKDLYEEALEDYLSLKPKQEPQDGWLKFLQYDETLKLMLRSIGTFLRRNAELEEDMSPIIRSCLRYCPDQFRFTWGITFVALEGVYLAGLLEAQDIVQDVSTYLQEQGGITSNKTYVEDFFRELRRPSYAQFSTWYDDLRPRYRTGCGRCLRWRCCRGACRRSMS